MNIAVARALGASRILACDQNPARLAVAATMGADVTIDPGKAGVVDATRHATNDNGADIVFEYTGNADGFRNSFLCVAGGGQIRLCATPPTPIEYDFAAWRPTRPTIYNIHGRRIWATWLQTEKLIASNAIDLRPVRSHILPLSEALRAFDLLTQGSAIKPILVPN
jgi:threonine 3-dehydrogenase